VKWLLYIALGILALNLFIIAMVGIVLLNDWMRNRKRPPSTRPYPRGVSDGGRSPTSPPS
jgi:hypothetical protein